MPIPKPIERESQDDFIARCMSNPSMIKEFSSQDQRAGVCFTSFRETKSTKNPHKEKVKGKELRRRISLTGLKIKEEGEEEVIQGIAATTHPDREGDIFSVEVLHQIVSLINDSPESGGPRGAYNSVSLSHDWIYSKDPTKDEAGFIRKDAKVIQLDDGHYGVKVNVDINKYYDGEMTPKEIKYRIEKGGIAGFSIEYDTDEAHSKPVNLNGKEYNYVNELTEFAGIGFSKARMLANPHALIYKEIVKKATEAGTMTKQKLKVKEEEQKAAEEKVAAEAKEAEEKELAEKKAAEENKELGKKEISVKEILKTKEFREAIDKQLQVKNKVIKQHKEAETMETPLCVKEMKKALSENNVLKMKEAADGYFDVHNLDAEFKGQGVPINTTLKTKCVKLENGGYGLRIIGELQVKELQTKDTLDTGSNTTTYTQNTVELGDVYLPGLIETFNNQAILFGKLPKRDNVMGSNKWGWRMKTDQAGGLSVDPDDPTVVKQPVSKDKYQTDIKEYRVGVSVTDYMIHHARASIGDLFRIEVEARFDDMMRDINDDLFSEQADGDGNQVLGLEAIADSAGNTTLYGLTRSTANRLSPAAAADTYVAVGGALTTALMRTAARKPEVAGALRKNLRYVANPEQRDKLFELEDGLLRYEVKARLGFEGDISYDGIIMWVDSSCQTDAMFVVDLGSYYVIVSRGPQVNGLAKVGAAEEAYVNIFFAVVYEQPRRIHMLDTLTTF